MHLAEQLTLSIVSHGHGALVETLVEQLDAVSELAGVSLVITLNRQGELFKFEQQPTKRVRLLIIRNASPLGFGTNHNNAFKHCATRWFAILNPDLSIHSNVFAGLIQTATMRGASLVAPLVMNSVGHIEDSVRWNLTPWALMKRKLRMSGEAELTDGHFRWFAGMFYLIESQSFAEIGGFDTRYFLYCEDYDICARMHLAGHRLTLQRDIRVIHDAQRDSWKSRRHLLLHLKSLSRVWASSPVWRIALRDSLRWARPRATRP
jgi:N-acetylglucosaminyl-diphospho-decaprenol L-rhamnosyltransferase